MVDVATTFCTKLTTNSGSYCLTQSENAMKNTNVVHKIKHAVIPPMKYNGYAEKVMAMHSFIGLCFRLDVKKTKMISDRPPNKNTLSGDSNW